METSSEKGLGWLTFASIMLIVVGVFNVLQGLSYLGAALRTPEGLEEELFGNLDLWGWVILVLGVLEILAGFGVIAGRSWARWFGIGVAGVNVVWHLMGASIYPVWSIAAIALNVLILYALAVYGDREGGVFG